MNSLTEPRRLLARQRAVTALFIAGLVLSGLTAIPIRSQVDASFGVVGFFPCWWCHRQALKLERATQSNQ